MTEQVVRPAGAGHETLVVALCCAVIVGLAALVVGTRATFDTPLAVEAHQLDARDDLTPAEQGLYADLRLVFEEITMADQGRLPLVAELREAFLPPFVDDFGAQQRGAHVWSLFEQGAATGYLGLSAMPEIAGSLLVLLDHGNDDSGTALDHDVAADVWLNREQRPRLPERLDRETLISSGWRQVVTRFDAGVTRHAH